MVLRVALRRSPRLAVFLLAAHLGAVALVPRLELATGWRLVLAVMILASLVRQWQRHLRSGVGAISTVQVSAQDEWSIRRIAALIDEPAQLVSHFAHPLLVVLRLKTARGREIPIILMPDTQDRETLRELRVRLRALQRDKAKGDS